MVNRVPSEAVKLGTDAHVPAPRSIAAKLTTLIRNARVFVE